MGSPLPVPPPGFDELNIEEQIDYIQALWDRIAAKPDRVPVPGWHQEIIEERLRDLDTHPEAGRPWDEVKPDLLRKTRGST